MLIRVLYAMFNQKMPQKVLTRISHNKTLKGVTL